MFLASVLRTLFGSDGRDRSPAARTARRLQEAIRLRGSGDVKGAIRILEGIVSRMPGHADAHYLIGLWSAQSGDLDRALAHLEQAVHAVPEHADAQLALGNVHRVQGKWSAARECYQRAVASNPKGSGGHFSLALIHKVEGDIESALVHLGHACSLADPYIEEAWRERVMCLVQLARYAEAEESAQAALAQNSRGSSLWACMGLVHHKSYRMTQAAACYERALALGALDYELETYRGMLLQDMGRLREAIDAYDRALQLKPGYELARFHRSLALLARHDFESGWHDYELRLISVDRPQPPRRFARWQGEPLAGKSVLVYGEQGLGDEIMFASCLPQLAASAARCIVTCSPRLESLFRRSFAQAEVVGLPVGTAPADAAVDYEVPAGSLPLHMRRRVTDFPDHGGYLRADPERIARWESRLTELGAGPKIGISWRGGTHQSRAPLRSVPLADWLPVFDVPGAHFVSLQYGDAESDLAGCGRRITHWREAIDDYDETAALVCALDLTVSVCTAVVHLAGALGRPVWIMAPAGPEWRYGHGGERMPWYPSARIFRQRRDGAWAPVLREVSEVLRAFVQTRTGGRPGRELSL